MTEPQETLESLKKEITRLENLEHLLGSIIATLIVNDLRGAFNGVEHLDKWQNMIKSWDAQMKNINRGNEQ